VVCSACDFFKKSIKFAVGQEAQARTIDLPEDDPEMIRRLIAYLYLGDYDPTRCDITNFSQLRQLESTTVRASKHHPRFVGSQGQYSSDSCACLSPSTNAVSQAEAPAAEKSGNSSNASEVAEPLTIHATMYALGDKYQVEGLGQLAKDKFESCLRHHACSADFATAIQIAYSSTPESNRGLRDVVVGAFRTQFQTDITQIPGAEAKLDSIDELSLLLIKSWPVKIEQPKQPSSLFGGQPQFGSPAGKPPFTTAGSVRQPPTTGSLFGSPSVFTPR
jgi:hypothetical protein